MEKVEVIQRIPGILMEGDVLISEGFGKDFLLIDASERRYVNLDYFTVVSNMPQYFMFTGMEEDDFLVEKEDVLDFLVYKTPQELKERYDFFLSRISASKPGSEQDVVYHNLIWFMNWLMGRQPLLK